MPLGKPADGVAGAAVFSLAGARHQAGLSAHFTRRTGTTPAAPMGAVRVVAGRGGDLSLGVMPRLRGGRCRRVPLPLGFDQLAAVLFVPCVLASIAAVVVIGRALGWV